MRDLDEEVVDLVGTDIVHKVVCPAIVSVHRAEVAADKVPLLIDIPRYILVLVVQKCRDDEPRGEEEDREEVVQGQAGWSEGEGVGDEGKGDNGSPAD